MDTRKTIETLATNLRPVRPIGRFSSRLLVWLAVAAVPGAALLGITGVRRDVPAALRDPWVLFHFAAAIALFLTASWGALRLSVPGDARRRHLRVPAVILALWILATVARVATAAWRIDLRALVPDTHIVCAAMVGGAAFAAGIPLVGLLRRAAPLDLRGSGILAALSAAGAGVLGVEFICLHHAPAHVLTWHVVPVALFALAGSALGHRLFRRSS